MPEPKNLNRRADLKAALRRTKADDLLKLEDLAMLWGTTKPRFVTVRNVMADFPEPLPGQGNLYVYPAKAAIEAMLAHETRHDDAARRKASRTAAILGRDRKRSGAAGGIDIGSFTPNELAALNRTAAELDERERLQGEYIHRDSVAKLAADIFSELAEMVRGHSNALDPHGALAPDIRAMIDSRGDDFLLRTHRRIKDTLSRDAQPKGNRKTSGRARSA